ncbi:MAG: SsrA-binding protein SmpB [Calditrichaeota bacterium]|nr:MAG: SsrA-binding protein SmpB [Calditrichota bacterium]
MHKTIINNRKARHDYEILNTYEAGIVLQGTEVKSLREGKANLTDAYARFSKNGELWLIGMHINPYAQSTVQNHDPLRDRKLLLHRMELKKLRRQTEEKGVTLIPLKVYFKNHLVKIELATARGKKKYDKRAAIAEREMKRDLARHQKNKF